MTETKIFNNKNEGASVANSQLYQQPTKITGVLTSQIRPKSSANVDSYGYLRTKEDKHSLAECERTKCRECEIPVIFKIKAPECDGSHHLFSKMFCWLKPSLKKGDSVLLEGEFSPSKKSNRPSFTCYSYQIINHE